MQNTGHPLREQKSPERHSKVIVSFWAQVISAELNRVVVELLQQLLFWQERQKAQDPLKAAKKKRLVSGLR